MTVYLTRVNSAWMSEAKFHTHKKITGKDIQTLTKAIIILKWFSCMTCIHEYQLMTAMWTKEEQKLVVIEERWSLNLSLYFIKYQGLKAYGRMYSGSNGGASDFCSGGVCFESRQNIFLFSKAFRPALEQTQPHIQCVSVGSPPGVKAAGAWYQPFTSI
jgi:hypothetical protein